LPRKTTHRSDSGFTLIEALIAMIILVTGLVAVANLMIVSASSNNVANTMSATTAEASEVMDLLKSIAWTNLTPGGSLTADMPATNPDEEPRVILDPGTGALTQYNAYRTIPGVGRVRTRWTIVEVAGNANQAPARFITVTSDAVNRLARGKSAVTFTTFRTCTIGPPSAGPPEVCF
jgi:prepilin-type N-terminal cleavage/methylation domain-containing protein